MFACVNLVVPSAHLFFFFIIFLWMHTPSAAAFKNLNDKENVLFLLLLFLQRIDFALSGGGVLRSSNRASCLVLRENTHYTHTILLLMWGGEKTQRCCHTFREHWMSVIAKRFTKASLG